MRLGKLAAERDDRNFKLKALLRQVEVPEEYDFDTAYPGVPTPMFANDRYGDCVIAGRAHQTLRFEYLEQQRIITISDDDVTREYFRETGGRDTGLVVLRSLRKWRREGWTVARNRYKIEAFAEVDPRNATEVKAGMFADLGMGIGLSLPDNYDDAIRTGRPWADTSFAPNPRNGHYVYCVSYNRTGVTCVTWGQKQPMTWAFLAKYCDEAYAIVDALNRPKVRGLLDLGLLHDLLKERATAAIEAVIHYEDEKGETMETPETEPQPAPEPQPDTQEPAPEEPAPEEEKKEEPASDN